MSQRARLSVENGDVAVQTMFQSEHAQVAILEDGRTIVPGLAAKDGRKTACQRLNLS